MSVCSLRDSLLRVLDVIFSASAILAFLPLLIPITVVLRLTGENEVFFQQLRVGRDQTPFRLVKFATMLKDSPNLGTGTVTVENDPRVLRIGRFLRKAKINELPQLYNVLIGHMSIIGPRPQTPRCFNAFPEPMRGAIISVRPGLSGLGSIFFREEEKMLCESRDPEAFYDDVLMPYKGLLEQWYVSNRSLSLYLKCILMTVYVVLKPNTAVHWRVFPKVPCPPGELKNFLRYPDV